MLIAEEYVRDLLPVCSRERDRMRLVWAIVGEDGAVTAAS